MTPRKKIAFAAFGAFFLLAAGLEIGYWLKKLISWNAAFDLIGVFVPIVYCVVAFYTFDNDRRFRREVHDLYVSFIGYSGIKYYEDLLTWHLVTYCKWAKKSDKYKQAHPPFNRYDGFSYGAENDLFSNDMPTIFCFSALASDVGCSYADEIMNFYCERCTYAAPYCRSQAGVYLLRFHSEWGKFWFPREKSFEKYYKTIDELQTVKSMCFRSLWEKGFFFNNIQEQIEAAAEKALEEHRVIEEKYKYR